MLVYHPVFDIYHGVFRILQLLTKLPEAEIEIEQIRILDFYLLFPDQIANIRFPRDAVKYKKYLKKERKRYSKMNDPLAIYVRVEPYQIAALKYLASHNLIDADLLKKKKVRRTNKPINQDLMTAIDVSNEANQINLELLTGPLREIGLYGPNGLKARSKLSEYKYDVH